MAIGQFGLRIDERLQTISTDHQDTPDKLIVEKSASRVDSIFRGLRAGLIGLTPGEGWKESRPGMIGAMSIGALSLLYPELGELSNSEYRERISGLNDWLELSVAFNEYFDTGLTGVIRGVEDSESVASGLLDIAIGRVEKLMARGEMSERRKGIIAGCLQDMITVELWALQKGESLSFEDILNYKKLVNGINIVASATIAMDKEDFLLGRVKDGFDENQGCSPGNFEMVKQRYCWLLDNTPRNENEARLISILYSTLAADIADSWIGYELDKKLGVETFVTGALRETNGSDNNAEKLLKVKADEYVKIAEERGLGRLLSGILGFMVSPLKFYRSMYMMALKMGVKVERGDLGGMLKNLYLKISKNMIFEREKSYIHTMANASS